MKHVSNTSATNSRGSEKWLLLLVVIVGLGGLLLTFSSTPKEQRLDIEGIQLEGRMMSPSASAEVKEDYVLR
ncbi:hypothetical protein [Flavilitoribacter nigricans]|uniref:Uncharacterized protein n=1 Tax=Flavilitoribacter nigricans (strain ATCC 23147 / DSM 23189 / NBRC 102662 / NCIMB 1420 / SS-2) TaxID=1122177 RepID=A0A2D0N7X2_FLAN2|nr:hypothetical protein [Flavilitoribacter nigricans]PHN04614.1 hypothetical protein CRP01_21670 [Flavilitoribacter nigricans DSM 23189 = NBRC 102662]